MNKIRVLNRILIFLFLAFAQHIFAGGNDWKKPDSLMKVLDKFESYEYLGYYNDDVAIYLFYEAEDVSGNMYEIFYAGDSYSPYDCDVRVYKKYCPTCGSDVEGNGGNCPSHGKTDIFWGNPSRFSESNIYPNGKPQKRYTQNNSNTYSNSSNQYSSTSSSSSSSSKYQTVLFRDYLFNQKAYADRYIVFRNLQIPYVTKDSLVFYEPSTRESFTISHNYTGEDLNFLLYKSDCIINTLSGYESYVDVYCHVKKGFFGGISLEVLDIR